MTWAGHYGRSVVGDEGEDLDFRWRRPLRPLTAGHDAYWKLATERENADLRRVAGHAGPLTDDPVVTANRFTKRLPRSRSR
jgi:hypothetical protein